MKNLRRWITGVLVVLVVGAMSFVAQAQNLGAVKQAAKNAKISPDLYQVMQNNGPQAPSAPINGLG